LRPSRSIFTSEAAVSSSNIHRYGFKTSLQAYRLVAIYGWDEFVLPTSQLAVPGHGTISWG